MARQRFNIRQLTLTGSKDAMAAVQTNSLDDDDIFVMQSTASGGGDVNLVTAKAMQNYFSDIDVDAVSSGEYALVFIDPTVSGSGHSGFDFKRDTEGTSAISWNASANLLKIVGDLQFDHDGAYIDWADDQALRLEHISAASGVHSLRLSGSQGTEYLQFGAAAQSIGSSADGQLDIDAATKIQLSSSTIQMVGGAYDFDGTSYNISGSGGMTATMGGDYSLTGAGAFDIDVEGQLTLDGSSITIGGDSDVAVDIDAAVLTIDASSTADFRSVGKMLLSSSANSDDAIKIAASATNGGIDLIASGSNVALSIDKDSADFGTTIQVNVDNVTDASSKSTGALVVDGGAGIAKNLYVGGNLVVQGATTTVETTNMLVEDPLIQLGSASAGNVANDGDRGFILSLSGSQNAAVFWDHDSGAFALARTTNTSSDTEITIASYADLDLRNLDAAGTLNVSGRTDLDGVVDMAQSLHVSGAITADTTLQLDGRADFDGVVDMAQSLHVSGAITADATLQLDGRADFDAHVDMAATLHVSGAITADSSLQVDGATFLTGALEVADADVDFLNIATASAEQLQPSGGDFLYIDDDSANVMKKVSFAELGKYLSRGVSGTTTDSQGIKVGTDGSLELQQQEDFFVSGASNQGKTFALSGVSSTIATEVLDNSLAVYLNGQLQLPSGSLTAYGDGDYSIATGSVVMRDAIDDNDVVIIRYLMK